MICYTLLYVQKNRVLFYLYSRELSHGSPELLTVYTYLLYGLYPYKTGKQTLWKLNQHQQSVTKSLLKFAHLHYHETESLATINTIISSQFFSTPKFLTLNQVRHSSKKHNFYLFCSHLQTILSKTGKTENIGYSKDLKKLWL